MLFNQHIILEPGASCLHQTIVTLCNVMSFAAVIGQMIDSHCICFGCYEYIGIATFWKGKLVSMEPQKLPPLRQFVLVNV